MNPTILALLSNAPGVIEWIIAEEPTVVGFVNEAKTIITTNGAAAGGLALIGNLLSHAATTFPTTTTTTPPAVTK
jgi:hypothetical protein